MNKKQIHPIQERSAPQTFSGATELPRLTWDQGSLSTGCDLVAQELPVALVYNGISHAVMMATPGDLQDLALGFSVSEGILESTAELLDVEVVSRSHGIEVQLNISQRAFMSLKEKRRTLAGRTGCGLCGVESLDQAIPQLQAVTSDPRVSHQQVQHSLQLMQQQQHLQALTGAVHAAAWCDLSGTIRYLREDVGRHNALDKVLGALLYEHAGANFSDFVQQGFMIITSRASYEMVAKVARANIAVLAAVSAPTTLAVELAENCGISLIGFARSGRHVVYSHPERLEP